MQKDPGSSAVAPAPSNVELAVVSSPHASNNPSAIESATCDPGSAASEGRGNDNPSSRDRTGRPRRRRPLLARLWRHPVIVSFAMWWGALGIPMAVMVAAARFTPPSLSIGAFVGAYFATVAVVVPIWVVLLFQPGGVGKEYLHCEAKLRGSIRILALIFCFLFLYSFGPSIGAMEINEGQALQFIANKGNFVDLTGFVTNTSVLAEHEKTPGCTTGVGLFVVMAPLVAPATSFRPFTGPRRFAVPSEVIPMASESLSVLVDCYYESSVEVAREAAYDNIRKPLSGLVAPLGKLPKSFGLPLLIGLPADDWEEMETVKEKIVAAFGGPMPSNDDLFDFRATYAAIQDIGETARRVSDALTITLLVLMFVVPFLALLAPRSCSFQLGAWGESDEEASP